MPKLKYIKGKGFLHGIPMRDLSADEVTKFGGAEYLTETGLYKLERAKRKPKVKVEKKEVEIEETEV